MTKKERINQFAESFLKALKANDVELFSDHILSREIVQKVTKKEKYLEGIENYKNVVEELKNKIEEIHSGHDTKSLQISTLESEHAGKVNHLPVELINIHIALKDTTSELNIEFRKTFLVNNKLYVYPEKINFWPRINKELKIARISSKKGQEKGIRYSYNDFCETHKAIIPTDGNYFQNEILFFENNLNIDGNLELDENHFTIFVKGDLTVSGDILNLALEYGGNLYVRGKTTARNIIAGGAVFDLNIVEVAGFVTAFNQDISGWDTK